MSVVAQRRRLSRLFDTLERYHAAEVKVAAASVASAEQQQTSDRGRWLSAVAAGRSALLDGTSDGRHLADTLQVLASTQFLHNTATLERCEAVRMEAEQHHLQSRVKAEQIKEFALRAEGLAVTHAARTEQALADDRFLSRRAWKKAQTAL